MKILIKNIDKAENLIRSGGHKGTTSVNICEYIETIPLLRGDDVAPDTVIRIATVSREWLEGGVHGVMVLDIPDSHLKVDQKNVERIAELEECLLEYVNATVRLWTGSNEVELLEEKATLLLSKGGA
jgi:hypothetical protein